MESAPVSRAQLLRAIPATVGAGVVGAAVLRPAISEAALPTAEDYAFGTGSKVCFGAKNMFRVSASDTKLVVLLTDGRFVSRRGLPVVFSVVCLLDKKGGKSTTMTIVPTCVCNSDAVDVS